MAHDATWLRLEQLSAVGTARRTAGALADRLGCSPARTAEIELATTELATNLVKHATEGVLLVRSLRSATDALVEVVAVDAGPGMADVDLAFRDGHSTGGTLGIGLGAVARLADTCQVYSEPGSGTALAARFHPRRQVWQADDFVAGVAKPIAGEEECGDAYAVRQSGDKVLLMLCDGAGHGPLAATASRRAVRFFCETGQSDPEVLVRQIHEELRGSRGGALAVAELDPVAGRVQFVGIGNIAGAVIGGGRKQGMVCLPGIAGHQARSIRPFDYDLPADGTVVLHSDGLTDRWTLQGRERLFASAPMPIAMTLMRDAGTRRDDASIIVARRPA